MKLTDYVVDFFAKEGVRHVFGLTGGAAVHFFDSAGRHPDIEPVFNHHEQAASFAAEAYARVTNNLGVGICTTGPGVTNMLTGLAAAWLDSLPCVYISGQTRSSHTTNDKKIRQLGTQQINVLPLVSSMTKYAVMLESPSQIRYHLEKAVYLARSGRPGPVWIDVPLEFEWEEIEPEKLRSFDEMELKQEAAPLPSPTDIQECLKLISESKRPLLLVGNGVRLSHAEKELVSFLGAFPVPFLSTWTSCDLMPTDHESYVGRPGLSGQRGANLAIQNCDLLLAIGSHLPIAITGTMFDAFARDAKRVVVDIDPVELDFKTVRVDLSVRSDAKAFLKQMIQMRGNSVTSNIAPWKEKCKKYAQYNRVSLKSGENTDFVDHYHFIDSLSEALSPSDFIVVDGGGTNVYVAYQACRLKKGQRMVLSTSLGAMGSGLPESIGTCFANNKRRTICLCGDGSLQLNIQELQTIVHHHLPIKVFVFNNDGYLSIRQTQASFLDSNFVGSENKGGMSLPNYRKIAEAYGLRTMRIHSHGDLKKNIEEVLSWPGPSLCEVVLSRTQKVIPTQKFDQLPNGRFRPRPLEDMDPVLDRKEFLENMIVKPWDQSQ